LASALRVSKQGLWKSNGINEKLFPALQNIFQTPQQIYKIKKNYWSLISFFACAILSQIVKWQEGMEFVTSDNPEANGSFRRLWPLFWCDAEKYYELNWNPSTTLLDEMAKNFQHFKDLSNKYVPIYLGGLMLECQTNYLKVSSSNPPINLHESFHIPLCALIKIANWSMTTFAYRSIFYLFYGCGNRIIFT